METITRPVAHETFDAWLARKNKERIDGIAYVKRLTVEINRTLAEADGDYRYAANLIQRLSDYSTAHNWSQE